MQIKAEKRDSLNQTDLKPRVEWSLLLDDLRNRLGGQERSFFSLGGFTPNQKVKDGRAVYRILKDQVK